MLTRLIRRLISILLLALLLAVPVPSLGGPPSVIDLGTLGGPWSYPTGINFQGEVVGVAWVSAGQHAFLWQEGVGMQDIGILPGGIHSSRAEAINRFSQVVGHAQTAENNTHAFLWTRRSGMQDLGTLPGGYNSIAMDINDAGQIVGSSDTGSGETHAVLWTETGQIRDLGTLGGSYAMAHAINNAGVVIGMSEMPGDEFHHVFMWTAETGMQDLGHLGWDWVTVEDINGRGEIVGWGQPAANQPFYGFMWSARDGMQQIRWPDVEGGTRASAINDIGQVVGEGYPGRDGFVWTAKSGIKALVEGFAIDINNRGQAIGQMQTADDYWHACLWPSSMTHGRR